MKPLRSVLEDLVQRRLWPVAVVLALAIAAVPLILSKSSAAPVSVATPATAPAVTADAGVASDTTVVDTPASGRGLAALNRRDPFKSQGAKKPESQAAATGGPAGGADTAQPTPSGGAGPDTSTSTSPGTSPSTGAGTGTSSSGSSVTPDSTNGSTDSNPGSSGTQKPHDKQESGPAVSLDVAFGRVSAPLARHHALARLSPLPGRANPVVIFLGVKGKGTAVLLVSSEAEPVGDGTCHPSPKDCLTVWLHAGETEFFKVTPPEGDTVSYQLNLKHVHVRPRASAKASAAAVSGPHGVRWKRLGNRLGLRDRSGFDGVEAGVQALDGLAVSAPAGTGDDSSAMVGAPATGGDVILP